MSEKFKKPIRETSLRNGQKLTSSSSESIEQTRSIDGQKSEELETISELARKIQKEGGIDESLVTQTDRKIARMIVLAAALAVAAPPLKTIYEDYREQDRIEQLLGRDLYERIKLEGGSISSPVFSGDSDKTIVHLGQIHNSSNPFSNDRFSAFISDNQKKIFSVVSYDAEQTKNYRPICLEGYSTNLNDQKFEETKSKLGSISSTEEFRLIAEEFIGKNMRGSELANIRFLLINWASQNGFVFKSKDKVSEVYEKDGQVVHIPRNYWLGRDSSLSPEKEHTFFGGTIAIKNSRVKLSPCEAEEANEAPFLAEREMEGMIMKIITHLSTAGYERIDKRLASTPESAVSNGFVFRTHREEIIKRFPEMADMYGKYDELSHKAAEATFVSRERIAVKFVTQAIEESKEKYGYIVYGAAHDFTQAVKEYNATVKGKPYNLVRVTFSFTN